jgi:hypothetical protein
MLAIMSAAAVVDAVPGEDGRRGRISSRPALSAGEGGSATNAPEVLGGRESRPRDGGSNGPFGIYKVFHPNGGVVTPRRTRARFAGSGADVETALSGDLHCVDDRVAEVGP